MDKTQIIEKLKTMAISNKHIKFADRKFIQKHLKVLKEELPGHS